MYEHTWTYLIQMFLHEFYINYICFYMKNFLSGSHPVIEKFSITHVLLKSRDVRYANFYRQAGTTERRIALRSSIFVPSFKLTVTSLFSRNWLYPSFFAVKKKWRKNISDVFGMIGRYRGGCDFLAHLLLLILMRLCRRKMTDMIRRRI